MLCRSMFFNWFWPVTEAFIGSHEYITEDGINPYTAEDGATIYITEN